MAREVIYIEFGVDVLQQEDQGVGDPVALRVGVLVGHGVGLGVMWQ